jgi:hypothetical protein
LACRSRAGRTAEPPQIQEWSERAPESVADFSREGRTGDHRLL